MAEASLSPHRQTDVISSSTFDKTWSPGAAKAFDVSTLPVTKAHKAWERRPQAPRSNAAKYKRVWKTYGLRTTHEQSDDMSEAEAENDRARAVKRMFVNGSTAPIPPVIKSKARKNYAGTKFDRRKSGVTRKTRVLRDLPSIDGAMEQPTDADDARTSNDETDGTKHEPSEPINASPERASTAVRKRRSLGRHSLGANRSKRRSLGAFTFGSIAEEPANEVEALCLSPRKKARRVSPVRYASKETRMEAAAIGEEAGPSISDDTNDVQSVTEKVSSDLALSDVQGTKLSSSPKTSQMQKSLPLDTATAVHEADVRDAEEAIDTVPEITEPSEEPGADVVEPAVEAAVETADADTESQDIEADANDEDLTTNWADDTTAHLDLDTALLKDFLSRTAAAKATRVESGRRLSLPRRVSLQNRRDSDAVRMALASPRKPLDDKDPNSPAASPAKLMDLPGVKGLAAQLDAITGGPLGSRLAEGDDDDTTIGSRRSARQRTRLPGPLSGEKAPNKISVKRTDGSDAVVLKKTEAQELSNQTRSNTRRNKGTSLARLARLKKLKVDGHAVNWTEGKVKEMAAINLREDPAEGDIHASEERDAEPAWKVPADGEKGVRWRARDDLLSFFAAVPAFDSSSDASLEDLTSRPAPPSTISALSGLVPSVPADTNSPRKKAQPARMRRLRGLGAANGTPGRGLLSSASLLPDEVAEEKEQSKLPAPRERKSRIAAPTPKKLKLTLKNDENTPSMLKPPEVTVPKSLGTAAATSLPGSASKEAIEARERRLASPRKIPQFSSGLAVPSAGGSRRKRM